MKKRIFCIILAFLIVFPGTAVFADQTVERAKALYDLGLLKGTGSSFSVEGLELSRNATRAEASVTIVRMLGKEEKANYQQNAHPFGDVPSWAGNYVGWLYENYLVNGVGDTYFGAQDIITVQQFATMLLRVLGYDDSRGDFSYTNAVSFAKGCSLIDSEIASHYELSRKDMINMCYTALKLNMRNSSRKLINKLCDEKAVEEAVATWTGILKEDSISDAFPDVPQNLGKISVFEQGGKFTINLSNPAEEYGLRVFVKEKGGVLQEAALPGNSGSIRLEKGDITYPSGSAAGYVTELYIYGLSSTKEYSFIVIKASSEGAIYNIYGKSAEAHN